jgi:hypothetical protein
MNPTLVTPVEYFNFLIKKTGPFTSEYYYPVYMYTLQQGRRVHGCGGSIASLQKCSKHISANLKKKKFVLQNIN